MGRSTTPKYRIEFTTTRPGCWCTPQFWDVRGRNGCPGNGLPTTQNIEKWVQALEESCQPGKPNAHVGPLQIKTARIVNQFTGEVVASWTPNPCMKQ